MKVLLYFFLATAAKIIGTSIMTCLIVAFAHARTRIIIERPINF